LPAHLLHHLCAQLIKKLKQHQVLIVTAPTGSGKSTQLPQYVLDHVLGPSETRQVAVLQPRRVNASSLCDRVAEERGTLAGREVGYTVGRGEEKASSETRIRFMTHGLFVQLAKDPQRFARKLARTSAPAGDQQDADGDLPADPSAAAALESVGYAAVILDEAHERSAEIDMSLALIKRLVAATDVRVIVTSATIGSSKEVFRNFLREGPDKPLPEVVELTGKTYPVFVQRCDISMMTGAAAGSADASLHDKSRQLGSAGVGKVLCQVALEQAVELLQSSADGNVLVFMPGEGDINRALSFCHSRFSDPFDPSATTFDRPGKGFSFHLDVDADADHKVAGAAVERGGGGWGGGKSKSKRKSILVGIHPFHGKLTSAERDAVLNPREDRVIVFTTNYAETGITVDNVRYVIDTGLERRARFNHHTNMQELITKSITKSSMRQRTGRAGRVSSGICVRLYSADDEAKFVDEPPAAITEANIEQTVLRLVDAQKPDPKTKQAPPPLEMIESLPKEAVQLAKQRLRTLGLLEKQTIGGREVDLLTSVGRLNLNLGLGVRLGLFLYHCAYPGRPESLSCLAAGVYLAAALSSSDHVKLLPLKPIQSAAAAKAPSHAPHGFEVENGSGQFSHIQDTAVVARLRQLLQDQKPVSYESRGQQYTARVEKGEIVQTNNATGKERKVRQVQTPAATSWASSLWGFFGTSPFQDSSGDHWTRTSPFQDSSGDHWTLLRTVKGFIEEATCTITS
jgi:ATP-dependent helicase HrpA